MGKAWQWWITCCKWCPDKWSRIRKNTILASEFSHMQNVPGGLYNYCRLQNTFRHMYTSISHIITHEYLEFHCSVGTWYLWQISYPTNFIWPKPISPVRISQSSETIHFLVSLGGFFTLQQLSLPVSCGLLVRVQHWNRCLYFPGTPGQVLSGLVIQGIQGLLIIGHQSSSSCSHHAS